MNRRLSPDFCSASLFWCTLIILFGTTISAAQYRFDRWTANTGLPQNAVYSILQTKDGYLWLTTLDGLVRYDGVRFTVFDKGNTKGLVTSRFIKLFEARDGALWIVAEENGLVRYKDGKFTSYSTTEGLPSKDVRMVRDDADGNVLVFTRSGTAIYQNGMFQHNDAFDQRSINLSSRNWFAGASYYDEKGLHVFSKGRYMSYTKADGLPSLELSALYEDQQGTLWAGTRDAGLLKLKDGHITSFGVKDGLPANEINLKAAHEDREGNVWISTDKGLGRLKDGRFTSYDDGQGLSSKQIINIYEDREGNIWLATFSDGLFRIKRQAVAVYSEREGLSLNNTYTILEDGEANLWIGTWAGGLNRLKDDVFSRVAVNDWSPHASIGALYEDSEGRLWVASGAGVSIRENGQFKPFSGNNVVGPLLPQAILQDRDGAFWFGCLGGLARYKDAKFNIYTTKDGLADNNVTTLYQDSAGVLWIGTYRGLSRFINEGFINDSAGSVLSGTHIRALYEDKDRVLWVGTYDSGLYRLKDGKLTSYNTRNGLYNNGAFRILDDERGSLWMSCNRGVYRVSKNELTEFAEGKIKYITSVSYGLEDGLLNPECNGGRQPAGWKTRDGRLWFPTQGGVAVINPDTVGFNPQPPPVVIEEFIVANAPVAFDRSVQILPGQENFEVHYTGLSFIKPEQVRFKYKLENVDKDWVDAGARRTAYYSYVPPGEYTFTVIAANSDGVWNRIGANVYVRVVPPFWRTWWFTALATGCVAGVMIMVYAQRIRRLKRAHEMQRAFSRQLIASQEAERKRIAAELHDSLGQSLVIIKNQALLSLSTPENARRAMEQMADISSTASDAISEVKEIAYNLRPYQLDRLGLTKAIESIINKASSSSTIKFAAAIEPIDSVFTTESEINVYRILQESINNIIKHSEATEARLEITRDERGVLIRIMDNGKGFVTDDSNPSPKPGLGLMGISERARMLGAKHEVNSTPGKGTTVTIKLGLEDRGDEE